MAAQFQRGISVYPSLGDDIHSASTAELAEIYKRPTQSSVRMGTLHQDQDLPVYPMWTRWQYVLSQYRYQVALILVPLLFVIAWSEIVRLVGLQGTPGHLP